MNARAARAVVALLALGAAACDAGRPQDVRAKVALADALGGAADAGYARATGPRAFEFPRDHGPHDGFKTEWWYVTGHLEADDGRRFGVQLTFFRQALAPEMPPRASAFAARHAFMAHFALTDVAGRRFRHAERLARGAAGLAGARAAPFEVFLEDWSLRATAEGAAFPAALHAAEGDVALDLVLEQGRAPVLQGDAGLSRKGDAPGNASYYYSLTRMPAHGTLRLGAERLALRGHAWLDREWGTSALAPGIAGWDWFALQLDDGRDLMFYRLRREDGGTDPWSRGSIAGGAGVDALAATDVRLVPEGTFESARGSGRRSARWRLAVPRAGLDLTLVPVLADQELTDTTVTYWEGAVDVRGSATGRGYVEMTGYLPR